MSQTPISIANPGLIQLLPELSRLLGEVARQVEQPRPLAWFRDEVVWDYRNHSKTARLKMAQAFRELLAIAGEGAMTTVLSPQLIARFAARAGRASTTNGLLASLHAAFMIGAGRHYVTEARVNGCTWRVPPDSPRRRHLAREQIRSVLQHLRSLAVDWHSWRLYALAMVYAFTGVRRNEALMLRVSDVDLEAGFLRVTPHGRPLKTPGSEAPVPIPRALRRVLAKWIPLCDSEWLFPKDAKTGPWIHGKARCRPGERLRIAAEQLGVLNFTSQTLRHSLATHLVSYWGLTTKQAQLMLRHTKEQTTSRWYIHPDVVNLGELVRDFDYAGPTRESRGRHARPALGHGWKRRPTRRRNRVA